MLSTFLHPYPAFKLSAFLIVGIMLGNALPGNRTDYGVAATCLLLLSLICLSRVQKPESSIVLTLSFISLWIALGALKWSVDTEPGTAPPDSLLDRSVVIVGQVMEDPHIVNDRARFVIDDACVMFGSGRLPLASTLVTVGTLTPPVFYGMTAVFRGRLFRPEPERNPGEFNQRQYYEANGIFWRLSVGSSSEIVVLDSSGGSWFMRSIIVPERRYCLSVIDSLIGGQEGEFLKGILLGERSGIAPEIREAFTLAGVAHILAVSGSNVAVVAGFFLFGLELFRFPRKLRVLGACAGVVWYMLLVGNQASVVRATLMAIVLLLGSLFQERTNPVNSLGIAALIILGHNSRQLFDIGFQLSFLAVFSIVYLYPKVDTLLRRIPETSAWGRGSLWLLRLSAVSLVATLGTLPVTAVSFGRVSVIGLVANVVVIPASGLSLLLGFCSVLTSLVSWSVAGVYADLNKAVLELTLEVTVMSGSLEASSVEAFRFVPIDALPWYTGLMLAFHAGNKVLFRMFTIMFLIALNVWLFVPTADPFANSDRTLRISFVDVGQGDAALVETPEGRTILIDTGPFTSSANASGGIVPRFLKRRGISHLDVLVVTHPHNDHLGGALGVLNEFNVLRVVDCGVPAESDLYRAYVHNVTEEQCRHNHVRAGELLGDDPSVRLYVLSPWGALTDQDSPRRKGNLNNASVVIKVVFGDVSVLFTGDAEEEVEERLVQGYEEFLRSTVLKVGHHGSRTSSIPAFVHAVRPAFAVISVGQFNRYGHPSSETIRRLEQDGAVVARTDIDGAIIVETDGRVLKRLEWR